MRSSLFAIVLLVLMAGPLGASEPAYLASEVQGQPLDSSAMHANLNEDGTLIVYDTRTPVDANDLANSWTVMLHNTADDSQTIVSHDGSGAPANGNSLDATISNDGQWIVFTAKSNDLGGGSPGSHYQIYVYEVATGNINLVTQSPFGVPGDQDSDFPKISGDGNWVTFRSRATNLPVHGGNERHHIYLWDRVNNETHLISQTPTGELPNHDSARPNINRQGTHVVYQSQASNIIADDVNGASDVFVWARETGATRLVSQHTNGNGGNGDSFRPDIDDAGRYVVYHSYASNLVVGDTNFQSDVFRYDLQTHQNQRISVNDELEQGAGSSINAIISDGGRYILYESTNRNLAPADDNNANDIFIVDMQASGGLGRKTVMGSVASDGSPGNAESTAASISGDSTRFVFISHATNIAEEDLDGVAGNVFTRPIVHNVAPGISFTYTPTNPSSGDTVTFNVETFDRDGVVMRIDFCFGDGTCRLGEDGEEYAWAEDGNYFVTVTATDDDGNTNTASTTISVTNKPPIPSFTHDPVEPDAGATVTFTSTSTDTDGTITEHDWLLPDGSTHTGSITQYTFPERGSFPVRLTVTDDGGDVRSITNNIHVRGAAPILTATASVTSAEANDDILFTASAVTDDADIIHYQYDWGEGQPPVTYVPPNQNVDHSWPLAGTYTVTVTVTDDQGLTDTEVIEIEIRNDAPTAHFTFPAYSNVNTGTVFTDNSTDTDGTITGWQWDFGDGTGSNTANPHHFYHKDSASFENTPEGQEPEGYAVSLTVTDNAGDTSTYTERVIISNAPPTVQFDWQYTRPLAREAVQFSSTSFDSDGDGTATHEWDFGNDEVSYEVNPVASFPEPGEYAVSLTVTDDQGLSKTNTQLLEVISVESPVCIINDDLALDDVPKTTPGFTIPLLGLALLAIGIRQRRGPIAMFALIMCAGGLTTIAAVPPAAAQNIGVVADFSYVPSEPHAGQTMRFWDESNDPLNRPIQKWFWNFDTQNTNSWTEAEWQNGVSIENFHWDSTQRNPEWVFNDAGTYNVLLLVTVNEESESGNVLEIPFTRSYSVEVRHSPPDVGIKWRPLWPSIESPVTFTSLTTDLDSGVLTHTWSIPGAEQDLVGEEVRYHFFDPGEYRIILNVEDDDGNIGTDFILINVTSEAREQCTAERHPLTDGNEDSVSVPALGPALLVPGLAVASLWFRRRPDCDDESGDARK